ncbi:hypothetical protein VZT92_015622 [Zoarces viviparus]|uniref:C-type lectin domain-containing protein n=1 Tax=Zoarces viviparus TaxID=48416 RepID=A0AAW1EYG6_ZOAVI
MTWVDAEIYCVSQGANLVSIHSLEEQNFVTFLIKNFDLAETNYPGALKWNDDQCSLTFPFVCASRANCPS